MCPRTDEYPADSKRITRGLRAQLSGICGKRERSCFGRKAIEGVSVLSTNGSPSRRRGGFLGLGTAQQNVAALHRCTCPLFHRRTSTGNSENRNPPERSTPIYASFPSFLLGAQRLTVNTETTAARGIIIHLTVPAFKWQPPCLVSSIPPPLVVWRLDPGNVTLIASTLSPDVDPAKDDRVGEPKGDTTALPAGFFDSNEMIDAYAQALVTGDLTFLTSTIQAPFFFLSYTSIFPTPTDHAFSLGVPGGTLCETQGALCTGPNVGGLSMKPLVTPGPEWLPDQPTRAYEGGSSEVVGLFGLLHTLGYSAISPIGEQKNTNRYKGLMIHSRGVERKVGIGLGLSYLRVFLAEGPSLKRPINIRSPKGRQPPKLVYEDQSQQGRTLVRGCGASAAGLSGEPWHEGMQDGGGCREGSETAKSDATTGSEDGNWDRAGDQSEVAVCRRFVIKEWINHPWVGSLSSRPGHGSMQARLKSCEPPRCSRSVAVGEGKNETKLERGQDCGYHATRV
ncbi:hypothetical protein H4582DRAFT_2061100 [Lactarius indigo]|nr:hypothetical protein H4582DRAFT_2061100 [Lactarius indigo]